jgi:hypothetical protein
MATAAGPKSNGVALVPPNATSQLSYSGTPRGPDGITYPDDYVDKLRNPITRMQIFEEMGNDDAVHTGVDARRQEICAANWSLTTEDKSTSATQILEYCEDTVYPFLDDILRLLGGGAMQYGFGALEPVLQWSNAPIVSSISRGRTTRATRTGGGERIYLRKLAHIRQPGVWTFTIAGPKDPTARCRAICSRCASTYSTASRSTSATFPPRRPALVVQQAGRRLLGRAADAALLQGYTFKQQIERLNLLHLDKFASARRSPRKARRGAGGA